MMCMGGGAEIAMPVNLSNTESSEASPTGATNYKVYKREII